VKELQAAEFALTRPGQILFAYQHFAPDPGLLQHVIDCGLSCVAYETVADATGAVCRCWRRCRASPGVSPRRSAPGRCRWPTAAPACCSAASPACRRAKVVIVGAGSVGTNTLQIAVGMGAQVTLFDRGIGQDRGARPHLPRAHRHRRRRAARRWSAPSDADLVIGAVLVPGKLSPKFIPRDLLKKMRPGSAIVDVGIDQGGIAATSRPTSHSAPLFVEEGIVHYCVPNMPSAVARTATLALTQATLPYALKLANLGLRPALEQDAGFMQGLQVHAGKVTHAGLAEDTRRPHVPPTDALAAA
jgi:alanine dehydrogenase